MLWKFINAELKWLQYRCQHHLNAERWSGYGILKYNRKEDFYLERKVQSEDYKVISNNH